MKFVIAWLYIFIDDPDNYIFSIDVYNTIPTASFNNDSPVINIFIVLSTEICWNNAVTLTGSVADINALNAADCNGVISGYKSLANPYVNKNVIIAANIVPGIAYNNIDPKFLLNATISILKHDENIIGGRITTINKFSLNVVK